MTTESIFDQIRNLLVHQGIEFKTVHHEATFTSEESARARGEEISIGGKAIVMKLGESYKLFVLSAALRIDSRKIKEHFQEKKIRFASAEELMQLTGLVPGAVPPFGRPILPFDLFVDLSITANKKIAFNAGSLTDSIIMSVADYLPAAEGTTLDFAQK